MTESRVLAIRPSAYDPPVPPSQPQKLEKSTEGGEVQSWARKEAEKGAGPGRRGHTAQVPARL